MVGATLLLFTGITVALSYVDFGTQKANIAVAMLVATFKAGLVAAIFMHLSAEKKIDLSHPDLHRSFRVRSFLAHVILPGTIRSLAKCRLKGFHIVFIIVLDAARAGRRRVVPLGRSRRRASRFIGRRDLFVCRRGRA